MIRVIDGGLCAVPGVSVAGLKEGKNGLALVIGSGNAACVSSQSRIKAAPVVWTERNIKSMGKLDAIIANSGCANAFTGEEGMNDAKAMAEMVADKLGVDETTVAVASTGLIGRKIDLEMIRSQHERLWAKLSASSEASKSATKAIMTTDTVPKEFAVYNDIRIGAICKGSGMIAPNLGTMLTFIYTDASFTSATLERCLRKSVDVSFNMLVIDGDTSPNDMVILVSTCERHVKEEKFQSSLDFVCENLARQIAMDGEGVTKLITCEVSGASTREDARRAARSIVGSPLVKAAIHGSDPNWGRIIAALGHSGAELREDEISLYFSDGSRKFATVKNGEIVSAPKKEILEAKKVYIHVDLGISDERARAWGCDLSPDYVKMNMVS